MCVWWGGRIASSFACVTNRNISRHLHICALFVTSENAHFATCQHFTCLRCLFKSEVVERCCHVICGIYAIPFYKHTRCLRKLHVHSLSFLRLFLHSDFGPRCRWICSAQRGALHGMLLHRMFPHVAHVSTCRVGKRESPVELRSCALVSMFALTARPGRPCPGLAGCACT